MRLGVIFPQTEIGSDPAAIRDYAQAVEGMGYRHLLAYDHVLGGEPRLFEGRRAPYTHETPFHEPFVLFGYLGGLTQQLEFVTGILIAPQRQTALIAKQAAAVDVLTGGRLRLGVGIGWNHVEYAVLNENFHNRGRRLEEQIAVLRALWTQPVVSFSGKWHTIDGAGIKPLPVQQPIPIWMGGMDDRVLRRMAKLADGWFPQFRGPEHAAPIMELLHGYLREAGREPSSLGIEGRTNLATGSPDDWQANLRWWQEIGATHLSVNTMGAGFTSPQQHIDAVRRFLEVAAPLAV